MRVSLSSRKSYASGTAQFLKFIWEEKPELLNATFCEAVAEYGEDVNIALIKSRLPGITQNDEEKWPSPLKWDEIGAEDVIQWLLSIQETGKLSKTQLGVKRSAVRNLFLDYQAGESVIYWIKSKNCY
jgi:hypothetical protein